MLLHRHACCLSLWSCQYATREKACCRIRNNISRGNRVSELALEARVCVRAGTCCSSQGRRAVQCQACVATCPSCGGEVLPNLEVAEVLEACQLARQAPGQVLSKLS